MLQRDAQHLKGEVRKVFHDLERIVDNLADTGEARAGEAVSSIEHGLHRARDRLIDLEEGAVVRARSVGRHARTYTRDHPWQVGSVALAAAAAAVLIGISAARRRR